MNKNPLVKALEEIHNMAIEHPCLDPEAFEKRDIKSLVKQGGDICDWTMIAIITADALIENEKLEESI